MKIIPSDRWISWWDDHKFMALTTELKNQWLLNSDKQPLRF